MNVIKEVFMLAKLLFLSKPNDYDELEFISTDHFPFKRYRAMMWCGNYIYQKSKEEIVIRDLEQDPSKLHHEFIHLCQAKKFRTWFGYYLSYLFEWIKGNPIFNLRGGAYYTIPYEVEALANESDLEYTTIGPLRTKYDLKKRVKIYKLHQKDWRYFIYTLKIN